jgi:hypothetical protein
MLARLQACQVILFQELHYVGEQWVNAYIILQVV